MRFLKIFLILSIIFGSFTQYAQAQKLRKVWASKKIIAYDSEGNKIDSLTKDLRTQNKRSKYLDQIQVDLRQIEIDMKRSKSKEEKIKLQNKKKELLDKRIEIIQAIKEDKNSLVKEYYLVAGSFRKKKNAKNAVDELVKDGYIPFIFHNKYRKWYYVCLSYHRSYRRVNLKQFNLRKKGVDTWIYYWAE